MAGKKRLLWTTVLVCVMLLLPYARAAKETAHYFYLNACETCHPEDTFANEFTHLTGKKLSDFDFSAYNVFQESGRIIYEQETGNLSDEARKLPLLIIGDTVYAGTEAIQTGLSVRFGTTALCYDSRIYFITATACESCTSARKAVEALPAVVAIEIDGAYFSSPVEITEINISAEPELAMVLFDLYTVPDDRRIAPCVLCGNTWISGEADIRNSILSTLKNGLAMNTPQIELVQGTQADRSISLPGAIAAGVTAGFNPCALSMLLILAGALLSAKRHPLLYGLLYLAGKLVLYLGIGLIFAALWTCYAPSWFPLLVRILMTAAGAALILLNVTDAIALRAEQYGRERNRLPKRLYNGLQALIKRGLAHHGIALGVIAFALGMITGAGEFFCAGQIYAAVIVANVQAGGTQLPLLLYCLAFLIPSIVLLFAISISRRTLGSTDWILKRIPAIKWATAVMMATIIVYIWIM